MQYTDITAMGREQAFVNATDWSDSRLLKYANLVYHDLENAIVTSIDEDFFYWIFETELTDWVNEYTEQTATASVDWFKKVWKVEVKWKTTDTDYQNLYPNDRINFEQSTDWLENNLNPENWFWEFKKGRLFIYPTPTETVANWLRFMVIKALKDLTIASVEADVFPNQSELRQFHYIIALWLTQYIFRAKWMFDEAGIWEGKYEQEKGKMIRYLTDVNYEPMEWVKPSSLYLQR